MSIFSQVKSSGVAFPVGVGALCGIQVVSTLSYSVLYSTLVLYMTGKLGFSPGEANHVTGVFVAFNYALHLLGGYWGGRILSYRTLFSAGMVIQIVGCLLLASGSAAALYAGLGAFLAGCGLNVTCINCLLTNFFAPDDLRREKAFFWNYAAMNAGFFAGFTLSGYFQLLQNYEMLFCLASLGNLAALLLCLRAWPALVDRGTAWMAKPAFRKPWYRVLGFSLVLALPFVLSQVLRQAAFANRLVLIAGACCLLVGVALTRRQADRVARQHLGAFLVLMLVSTVFWTLFQTAPMGLTQFIEHNVARTVNGFTLPTQWFQNINTLTIIISGPLMAALFARMRRSGLQVSIAVQFTLALAFIGAAFVLLPFGIRLADPAGLVSPAWIVASFVLQSIGELLLSPVGYAMVGRLVPKPLQGVMMGMWMLTIGTGSVLAAWSSNLMQGDTASFDPLLTNSAYASVFLRLGLTAACASLVLFAMVPMLKRWMSETGASTSQDATGLAAPDHSGCRIEQAV